MLKIHSHFVRSDNGPRFYPENCSMQVSLNFRIIDEALSKDVKVAVCSTSNEKAV